MTKHSAAAAQRGIILEHLKHDTLTTLQARKKGLMRRAARYRLQAEGR